MESGGHSDCVWQWILQGILESGALSGDWDVVEVERGGPSRSSVASVEVSLLEASGLVGWVVFLESAGCPSAEPVSPRRTQRSSTPSILMKPPVPIST